MRGDYGDGSQLTQLHIEIDVDDFGNIVHAGAGYHVRVPSGKAYPSALTIHSPNGADQAPAPLVAKLEDVAREIARLAAEHEGVVMSSTTQE